MADPTRRQALIAGLGLALAPMARASSMDDYPDLWAKRDRTLAAFVHTVCPVPSPAWEDAIAALRDRKLPLAWFAPALIVDLKLKAQPYKGDFSTLSEAERVAVIDAGCKATGALGQLYTGAVFLVQVAYYAGMYHPRRGNPEMGFFGAYDFMGFSRLTFPDPEAYLGTSETPDGNPP